MNVKAASYDPAFPEPFRILGRNLHWLSLGRYRLLKAANCAYVSDDAASAGADDLIIGIIICSMRVDEFIPFARSKQFEKEIRRWRRRILPLHWLTLIPKIGPWWNHHFGADILEKMMWFADYIKEGSKQPDYFFEGDDNRESALHWSQSLEVVLRSQLGWLTEDINERPLTQAFEQAFAFSESRGSIRLISEEDVEHGEANAALIARALNGA